MLLCPDFLPPKRPPGNRDLECVFACSQVRGVGADIHGGQRAPGMRVTDRSELSDVVVGPSARTANALDHWAISHASNPLPHFNIPKQM